MLRILPLALLLVAFVESNVAAQLAPSSVGAAPERTALASGSLLSDAAQAEIARSSTLDRIGRHALYTLGFGLVGSGFGYFASQVAYSDWDKVNNSTFASERRAFSLTGAAIGAVGGFILGAREASQNPIGSRLALRQELAGRDLLLNIELDQSSATTAYEAVQMLRPSWFITRGIKQFNETGTGIGDGRNVVIVPGVTTIRVYVDNAFLGDIDTLRSIPLGTVISIERIDAIEATTRWGAGHEHGVILVRTMQGS